MEQLRSVSWKPFIISGDIYYIKTKYFLERSELYFMLTNLKNIWVQKLSSQDFEIKLEVYHIINTFRHHPILHSNLLLGIKSRCRS
jgi:hypothetical protein